MRPGSNFARFAAAGLKSFAPRVPAAGAERGQIAMPEGAVVEEIAASTAKFGVDPAVLLAFRDLAGTGRHVQAAWVAAANLDTHIRRARDRLGVEPTLSELYAGYQVGLRTMLRLTAARSDPSATLVGLWGPGGRRQWVEDLLLRAGLPELAAKAETVTCAEYGAVLEPRLRASHSANAEALRASARRGTSDAPGEASPDAAAPAMGWGGYGDCRRAP